MILEILEILGVISRPIKKVDRRDFRKDFIIFASYLVAAVCLIFTIREVKIILIGENPMLNVLINFVN